MWKKIIIEDQETNYSISDDGQVRNDVRQTLLKQSNEYEYKMVNIALGGGVTKRCRVHRLVAQAFIPNPENKPYVNHKDGNRSHNNVDNLEWVTASENAIHARQTGLLNQQQIRPVCQYNLDGKLMMIYNSIAEAVDNTGCLQSKIVDCCRGNRKTTGDYQWRYYDAGFKELPPVQKRMTIAKNVAQYDKEGNFIAQYDSFREAARAVNGTQSAISRICSGTPGLHTHKGFVWKIVDEIVQEEIDE